MAAEDSPFVGKWKLNPAKSRLSGITTTFDKLPSGEMAMTSQGQSYKFRIDGKPSKAASGISVTWYQVDPHNWITVYKSTGMMTTDNTKLSADGQTLTVVSKGTKPNGESFEETSTSQRISGGPGLLGKWLKTQMNAVTQAWDIEPYGADGLDVTIVDFSAACSAKFDGKDYPVTGPTVPKNYTLSMKKTGPRSLEIIEKVNGKVVYADAFSVSADGQVLTSEGAAPGSSEKTKAVYERQ
jgi:hypothetical protein